MENLEKLIIVKHNDLIDAAQRLSTIECRIILTCIAQINSKEQLDYAKKFIVSATDIADAVGIAPGDAYDKLKEAVVRLYQREVIFLRPSKRVVETRVRWVFQVDYIPGEGTIELSFSPPIVKLLSEITQDFTQYKLENVLKFRGQYSFRIYELICRWGGTSKEIALDELKQLLQLEGSYAVWKDFKRRILDPTMEELNAVSNIKVSWEGVKRGRGIGRVKFTYQVGKQEALRGTNTGNKKAVVSTKEKAPTVKTAEALVNKYAHYMEIRGRFGERHIPAEIIAEMKAAGLW